MNRSAQIKGLLLEEAVLYLLRAAGYRTVAAPLGDPTLGSCSSGLTVAGRGACHQIDAIADFCLGLPFCNPQRLLVEAKFLSKDIDLPTVRNTVGVIKDVSEYWAAASQSGPAAARYHYLAAVFSASPFTRVAQEFAFAHDIHLLPLESSIAFEPVLRAIRKHASALSKHPSRFRLREIRFALRRHLQPDLQVDVPDFALQSRVVDSARRGSEVFSSSASNAVFEEVVPLANTIRKLDSCLLAMLGRAFPAFLVPFPKVRIDDLSPVQEVEIHFEDRYSPRGWAVTSPTGVPLFSFNLPEALFTRYANEGLLSLRSAVDLKEEFFTSFTAIHSVAGRFRILEFRVEAGWFEAARLKVLRVLEERE